MNELRDHPFARLTRHFFAALFDFGVLSEKGTHRSRACSSGSRPCFWRSGCCCFESS